MGANIGNRRPYSRASAVIIRQTRILASALALKLEYARRLRRVIVTRGQPRKRIVVDRGQVRVQPKHHKI